MNDRTSVTLKEYLAGIDVSMGGRVAEELSKFHLRRPELDDDLGKSTDRRM